ncbi:hypothetical protein M0R72_11010 [Candidatus Pacearchaeota archaeon]|jgi:hypothetical protein|nr:hypothetical protein [Candidatus Pacearchaeota archaeon]
MANLNDIVTNYIPALISALKSSTDAVTTACNSILAAIGALPIGTFARPTGEITRPANATPYSSGDAIADNAASAATHAIDGCARVNGGSGQLFGAIIKTDNRAWTQALTVAIYDSEPTAFEVDNAAFPGILYADKAKCIATLTFPSLAKDADVAGACARAYAAVDGFPRSFTCTAGSKKLYWKAWLPSGTPTPVSGQKFALIPHIVQA